MRGVTLNIQEQVSSSNDVTLDVYEHVKSIKSAGRKKDIPFHELPRFLQRPTRRNRIMVSQRRGLFSMENGCKLPSLVAWKGRVWKDSTLFHGDY